MDGFIPHRWLVRVSAATILWSGLGISDHLLIAEPRVGGLDELVIYDPGKHDRGLAAVEFAPSPMGTQIEIQPTTHVHRYYYNGDKEYQGPLIQGGPTIVVASHPRTGKRMYIDANLPSGAPIIVYDKCAITYVYQDRRVVISFARFSDERAHVTFLPGHGIARLHREHAEAKAERHRLAAQQHSLGHSIQDAGLSVKKTIVGSVGTVGHVTGGAIDKVKGTVEALPPFTQLQSVANDRQEAGLREASKQALKINDLNAPQFFKTIR